jgi:TolB-like protein/Tfp pilus assembly protein PilF
VTHSSSTSDPTPLPPVAGSHPEQLDSARRRIPHRWTIFGIAVLGLLVVTLWLRVRVPSRIEPVVAAMRQSSLAVLPFINTNPDSLDDYLGSGIASELTRSLDRVPGLSVSPRSSVLALQGQDSRSVGRRLGVSTVLEGSIRRVGDRLRVTAHLVDVEQGFDLWADTYERATTDLPAIEGEVRRSIASQFRITLPDDSAWVRRQTPASFESYDAYLAGAYLSEQPGTEAAREAVAHLNRAIRLDSGFAPAYLALAEAYLPSEGVETVAPGVVMPRAEAAALEAVELDSGLAGAHIILGTIRFEYDREWGRAEAEFRRAIAGDSAAPEAYEAYSRYLLAMGRTGESLQASHRAQQLSPLAPRFLEHLGWHYLHARQYEPAREALRRAIALDSLASRPRITLALVEQAAGNYAEAIDLLGPPLAVEPDRADLQAALAQLYALTGRTEDARAMLRTLLGRRRESYVPSYLVACVQAALGQRIAAFASLGRAIQERSSFVAYLRIDPRLDTLRADRRFVGLLRQLRLP